MLNIQIEAQPLTSQVRFLLYKKDKRGESSNSKYRLIDRREDSPWGKDDPQ